MTSVSQVYEMEFYIEDAKGNHSIISLYVGRVGGEIKLPHLIALANALEALLDPITTGQIRRASVRLELVHDFGNTAAAGSDVRLGATFVVQSGEDGRRMLIRLPAFDQSLVVNLSTVRVNAANASVLALYNAWRLGFTISSRLWRTVTELGYPASVAATGAMDYQLNASRRRR